MTRSTAVRPQQEQSRQLLFPTGVAAASYTYSVVVRTTTLPPSTTASQRATSDHLVLAYDHHLCYDLKVMR